MSRRPRAHKYSDSNIQSGMKLIERDVVVAPSFSICGQLLVCFLRLAAAPRISAPARPRDAFHERPHAESLSDLRGP